ncbi:MAG: response regulator [bacterium]|nr:response regulator [bacterium]MDT8367298.1 response regulator [bacterium]
MSSNGKIILIVDDDSSIQELLRIILTKNGYTVHQAIDGEQAIHKYMEVQPDLVISDISMPKGDGFNVAIIIRSKEREGQHIPILLISAFYDDHANVQNAERCGADGFLPKPFTQKQLIGAVENLLVNTDG